MKNWLKILFVILIFAVISVILFFIFKIFNITDLDTLKQIIDNSNQFGLIVYSLIITLFLVLFCFVPLLNTSLIVLGIAFFSPMENFIAVLVANFISSSILFFIGDKFGEKFAIKLLGKKDFERAQNLVDSKSKLYLPLLFVIPGFPDEALCILAGMTKMKYWYLILVSCVYHAIETGLIIFCGENFSLFSNLNPVEWFMLINVLVLDIFYLKKLEDFIKKK